MRPNDRAEQIEAEQARLNRQLTYIEARIAVLISRHKKATPHDRP